MQANRKNRGKSQRRSLRIEKFEHRIVPAASIVPMDPMNVDLDVEDLRWRQPAVEVVEQGCQQAAQVNQLREGKGPGIWTARGTSGVTDTFSS